MKRISIVVADDHALFREKLRQLLNHEEDLECVAVAQDGEEAVALAKWGAPVFSTTYNERLPAFSTGCLTPFIWFFS